MTLERAGVPRLPARSASGIAKHGAWCSTKCFVEAGERVADLRADDVGVQVGGQADRGVPRYLHDHPLVDLGGQQQRCRGVPRSRRLGGQGTRWGTQPGAPTRTGLRVCAASSQAVGRGGRPRTPRAPTDCLVVVSSSEALVAGEVVLVDALELRGAAHADAHAVREHQPRQATPVDEHHPRRDRLDVRLRLGCEPGGGDEYALARSCSLQRADEALQLRAAHRPSGLPALGLQVDRVQAQRILADHPSMPPSPLRPSRWPASARLPP